MCCLLILVILAVYHDIKSFTIKNYIIIIGISTGLIFNFIEIGLKGIYPFIIAIFLPIIILFPLFIIKALGAGDIKLFSVIGCYLGISVVSKIFLLSLFIGGFISIIYLIKTKSFSIRFNHLTSYISNLIKDNYYAINTRKIRIKEIKFKPYYEKEKHGREGTIHFSIPILFALITYLLI